jgi:hypothetical protein
MIKPRKNLARKFALSLIIISLMAVGIDIAQHYVVLKFATNWLHSTGKRQNIFDSKLNFFSFNGASVDILNLVSTENNETVTIKKINLRKGLFDFNRVQLTAEEIVSPIVTAATLTGSVERTSTLLGNVFTFNPIVVRQINAAAPLVALTADNILMGGTYNEADHVLAINLSIPQMKVNQAEALGFEVKGNVTVHKPHNGELNIKIKGVEQFSDVLVQSGYLDKDKAQILTFGSQLLKDDQGNVPVKLHIKNNDIFLEPFRLTDNK